MIELDWGNRDPRWAGIRSDSITIDDVRVNLLRADPASVGNDDADPAATPILLVHGLGGASTNWLEVIAGLAQHAPVVAMDLPGFGDTEPPLPEAAHMTPQLTFLVRLLDALGWDRAEVHGNSMGGLLSTLLAGRHPDRVQRLVLVSPAMPTRQLSAILQMDTAMFLQFAAFRVARGATLKALRRAYAGSTPEEMSRRVQELVSGDGESFRPPLEEVAITQTREGMGRDWRSASLSHATRDLVTWLTVRHGAIRAATRAITADILLIWGDHDHLVPRAAMDALTTQRGDIARHDLAGVGHVAMIEVPDRYLSLVETWRSASSAPEQSSGPAESPATHDTTASTGSPAIDDTPATTASDGRTMAPTTG